MDHRHCPHPRGRRVVRACRDGRGEGGGGGEDGGRGGGEGGVYKDSVKTSSPGRVTWWAPHWGCAHLGNHSPGRPFLLLDPPVWGFVPLAK